MANPVVVEFVLKGMPDIARAMKTVEKAASDADRSRSREAEKSSKTRAKIEEQEAKAKIRSMIKADAEHKKAWEKATREAEKQAQKRAKAEEKAEKDVLREAERVARMKIQIARQVDREIAQIEKNRERERSQANKERERDNNRIVREAARADKQQSDERKRELKKRDADEGRAREKFGRGFGSIAGAAGRTALNAATGLAGTVSQLGGGFSIADALNREGQLEKSAMMLSNSAYMGKGTRMDTKELRAKAKAAAIVTGTDANEVLEGAHAFGAKTGAYGEGVESMKLFSEIAKVTGSKVSEVANTAGTLRIQNEDLKPEQMKGILLQTIRQGQKGSIEFGDLATSVGKITRTGAGYTQDQGKTQAELLGIAQLGMRTMTDPRDVATSLAGISSDTKKNWQYMNEQMGGDQFDKVGRIKGGPGEFVAKVMEKTGGDERKLMDLGFGKQSMKYFQALEPTFQKNGGGKAGADALRKELKESTAKEMPYEELQADLKNILNTSAEQFDTSMRELRTVVGTDLLPEFVKFVPVMKEAIPTVRRLVHGLAQLGDWAAKNPLSGMSALLGAAFAKELATAGIGKIMASTLGASMVGATIAITTATLIVESIADKQSKRVSQENADAAGSFADAAGYRPGDVISKDERASMDTKRAAAQALVDEQRKNVNKKDTIEHVGTLGTLARYGSQALTGGGAGLLSGALGYGVDKLTGQTHDESATYQKQREERLKLSEAALDRWNTALDMAAKGLIKVAEAANPAADAAKPKAPPPTATTGLAQRASGQ